MTGDGPVPARGMVVGEGPGFTDDSLQRPLVGEPGEFLDHMLADAGLSRSELYVTNATKCMAPPGPDKEAAVKQAIGPCKPFLESEIELVKPEVILVMGNAALKSVAGLDGVRSKRGMEFYDEKRNAWIIVTLHPAAVLREPQYYPEIVSDIKRFARRLRGEAVEFPKPEVIELTTVSEIEAALQEMSHDGTITFDLETQGFDDFWPWSKIWCIGLTDRSDRVYVIPLEHPESPFVVPPDAPYSVKEAKRSKGEVGIELRRWLALEPEAISTPELSRVWELLRDFFDNRKVNGHNIKFDARWGSRRGLRPRIWFDTASSSHLLNENRFVNLQSVALTELGVESWGKGKIEFNPPDSLPKLLTYCGCDVGYEHEIYLRHRIELAADQELARLFAKVLIPSMETLIKAEKHGVWFDVKRATERKRKHQEEHEKMFDELVLKLHPDLQRVARETKEKGKNVFSSGKFLQKWLFSQRPLGLGLTPGRRTKTGWAVDEKELLRLAPTSEEVRFLLRYREAENHIKFYNSWLSSVGPGDMIHPPFNTVGTDTGRNSSPYHTVPREVERRSNFGAPHGWAFIEADYSQVELRIAAILSQDPTMIAIFQADGDMHVFTAGLITGKAGLVQVELDLIGASSVELATNKEFMRRLNELVTDDERRKAKAVNFGFLYGMGPRKFRIYALEKYGVVLNEKECNEFRNAFFQTYSYLLRWHEKQRRRVRKFLRVRSPLGRIRRLPMILSSDEAISSAAERQAINSVPQGMAPDIIKITTNVVLGNKFDWEEARVIGEVHDAAHFIVREDKLEKWLPVIKHDMENPPLKEMFGFELPVPLKVDVKVGKHWGECKAWENTIVDKVA